MSKKFLTIQVLKQRISNMQSQLNKLQNDKKERQTIMKQKSLKKSLQKTPSPFRNTPTNKRYRSPTFWTGNTLLAEKNPYFNNQQNIQQTLSPKSKIFRQIKNKSPFLDKIKKQVDVNFYRSVPNQQINKQNLATFGPRKNSMTNLQQFKKQKIQPKINELNRQVQKVQKLKTYQLPRKNPILNPPPPKASGKKIPANPKPFISPENMYIQNPRSNPNIYFNPNSTQPIFLSKKPKHSEYFNRNKSPELKLLLSNSVQNFRSLTPTQYSSKKHFGKFYEDNFSSKWNVGW